MNQLNQLKQFTTVVADTSDINAIYEYAPEDATTNPSLILQAVKLSSNQCFIKEAVKYARKKGGSREQKIINASDKILIDIGSKILEYIPGYISSEVDARLSFNTDKCVLKAKKIINMYEDAGISRNRILIKLASTWQCIKAAEELQKDNILCNLTLLFSFAQARACAEANVFLISPFVGRIYDWYKSKGLLTTSSFEEDPGVVSVRKIFNFYKKYSYKTIIMGASFRSIEQILQLSGCDRLTISLDLLKKLKSSYEKIEQKLFLPSVCIRSFSKISESEFYWEHNQDAMAVEKLSEGIRSFAKDQLSLESILSKEI